MPDPFLVEEISIPCYLTLSSRFCGSIPPRIPRIAGRAETGWWSHFLFCSTGMRKYTLSLNLSRDFLKQDEEKFKRK
jgi:hypothetical protein